LNALVTNKIVALKIFLQTEMLRSWGLIWGKTDPKKIYSKWWRDYGGDPEFTPVYDQSAKEGFECAPQCFYPFPYLWWDSEEIATLKLETIVAENRYSDTRSNFTDRAKCSGPESITVFKSTAEAAHENH
jgi:hypothetical protein